mmetsp:Transcript_16179/g.45084  ORF Transcript_16179/g.45084 Transcript_16179/m.45084 type:complete len:463 (+) Transcript_16179:345-1733(+)|eukprot:CAMPEP_0117681056 /NCGR_PEP_ID=MMETSP0804-20121206/18736_1 /TAXON_ID=1074897 /ORGANISM="Tetraselmis astigmatica, Strain CCMP880" /LENGTH=462 /DNA_ID=CAMNT_0005490703 /DNA_START=259 /DNA_END=1647 /DNA_ORIENTATION=+
MTRLLCSPPAAAARASGTAVPSGRRRLAATAASCGSPRLRLDCWGATMRRTTVPPPTCSGRARPAGACRSHMPAWNDSYDGSCPDVVGNSRWDVLGLGQAIVDFSASVDEDFLEFSGVPKGGRKVISVDERGSVLSTLDGSSYKVNAGGSLSNTLVALARLGRAEAQLTGSTPLRVGLGGSIGCDALGEFYKAKIQKAGVEFISEPQLNSATGTVVVLTTDDAQRSFLSYPGTAHDLVTDAATGAIDNCRALVIEGYLWEMPGALEGISHAVKKARQSGTLVVMTAGDPGVVQRHKAEMLSVLELGVDVMFTNAHEAAALVGIDADEEQCAEEAAMMLASHATLGVVTDGRRGAYIAGLGRVQHVEPHWATDKPIDTCGAGDAYAAGVLYGLLNGYDIPSMGKFGARVASAVISRYGARLKKDDALKLAQEMAVSPAHGALLPPERPPRSKAPSKSQLRPIP